MQIMEIATNIVKNCFKFSITTIIFNTSNVILKCSKIEYSCMSESKQILSQVYRPTVQLMAGSKDVSRGVLPGKNSAHY